jgi:SAM-dependent methyltransferase
MEIEREVAQHYARSGLEAAILAALAASGRDPDRLAPDDLAAVDEFHLGWRAATVALAEDLALAPDEQVLDIGSGIGGPARHFTAAHGCRVVGIDLTEDFVRTAGALTRRCGLADRVAFCRASALALPFAGGGFDAATLLHVGMNIADKAGLFREARRVLKPGGRFGVYDLMRVGEGEIACPVPWATTEETSFVATADAYRRLLGAAGFAVVATTDRRELALALWREMGARVAREGPPRLGLHLLMGPTAPQRLSNVIGAVERGVLAPVQMVARAAG